MKMFKLNLWVFMLVTCNLACSQDDNKVVGLAKYKSCCGTEPRVYTVYDNSVYVPNVFTPNGDGVNDFFMPVARNISDQVIKFGNYYIRDSTGLVIYQRGLLEGNTEKEAWNGGTYEGGAFTYGFQFTYKTEDGEETEIVEGTACLIRCGAEAAEFEEKTGCYFASQGIGGIFNDKAERKEDGCFK